MKHFTSVKDVENIDKLVQDALELKSDPLKYQHLGTGKTMGIIFLNPSLRTRLSTQKAARNLGMDVMVMNFTGEGWNLETQDGVIMDGGSQEHIKEAAAVIGQYCDVIGIRSFPSFESREEDYNEKILNDFIKYAGCPVVSLESATLHPLQSLADIITIEELKKEGKKPKVVLSWAPHPRRLPQAVANSFAQWMNEVDVDLVITHPEGYDLSPEFVGHAEVTNNQDEALKDADFVYVKNWSTYEPYGEIKSQDASWQITKEKMDLTNDGKFMHCLPVRRNVIVSDEVLDSDSSVVIQEAGNREWSASAVLKQILEQ
ncbi:MAG: N-acetylornithine carbamoyltransferase [Cytophagales bacterium]|nr:N-acetylornithine carbamoyltransferase [Cytophagales bacterium]